MPTTYTLDIAFSAKDLQDIVSAQQQVAIARPTHAGHIPVAWLIFQPMMENEVSWTESGPSSERQATVNGVAQRATPVHAPAVPSGTQPTIVPEEEQVVLWLQSTAGAGTVTTDMPPATVLTFGPGMTTRKVRYNGATGMFDSAG